MQGIEFETDQSPRTASTSTTPKQSGILKLLAKFGVENTTMASYILLGVIAVLFGVAIFLYAGILSNGSIVPSGPVPAGMLSH